MVFVKRQKRYHPSLSVPPFVFVFEKIVNLFFSFSLFSNQDNKSLLGKDASDEYGKNDFLFYE